MLIGFTGYAQTGKDTCSDYLVERYGFEKHAFADKLREIVEHINPYVFRYPNANMRYSQAVRGLGYELAKKNFPEIRRLLKVVGIEFRKQLGDDIWVNFLFESIESFENKIVISDVRFLNEAAAIKAHGGIVVRVHKPGIGPHSDHISETELDQIETDVIIHNDGTIGELYLKLNHLLTPER